MFFPQMLYGIYYKRNFRPQSYIFNYNGTYPRLQDRNYEFFPFFAGGVRAAVRHSTEAAPLSRSTRTHSESVAPVVWMSSTSRMRRSTISAGSAGS